MLETIACNASPGQGGLGRHLECAIENARTAGRLAGYYATSIPRGDELGRAVSTRPCDWLNRLPPLRQHPAWRSFFVNEWFDRRVATMLTRSGAFVGFGGQARHSFLAARKRKTTTLILESATAHVDHVRAQQAAACRQWDLEEGWLNDAQRQKTLAEYREADVIRVGSPYALETFLAAGVPVEKIVLRQLEAHPRFVPRVPPVPDGKIRIVYVGALTVLKGVPALIEAFAKVRSASARLILVGGATTRGMRRYLEGWLARDRRITVAPGDPLPVLQQASVLVHPSFTDGFGLAPLEALRCKVPVVVTDHTGMKSLVQEGVTGYVVPTGNVEALRERLEGLVAAT